jgi:hypothetical protein
MFILQKILARTGSVLAGVRVQAWERRLDGEQKAKNPSPGTLESVALKGGRCLSIGDFPKEDSRISSKKNTARLIWIASSV